MGKFTPEGGRIDVRAVPGDGGWKCLGQGHRGGHCAEDQEAIFEEFGQVGTTGGSGSRAKWASTRRSRLRSRCGMMN